MRHPNALLPSSLALVAAVLALGFLGWTASQRMRHTERVSRLAAAPVSLDANSPTGFAGETRNVIVPAHHHETYDWVVQAQSAAQRGDWRVRRVEYDNAPVGRPVASSAPYRWWLTILGWAEHHLTGKPLGAAIEHAVLYANPLLHVVTWLVMAILLARYFGLAAGTTATLGVTTLFPLAAGFLPGIADAAAISHVLAGFSVLLLAIGWHRGGAQAKGWFALSGVVGGVGLWIAVSTQWAIVPACALGGALAHLLSRRLRAALDCVPAADAWRWWGLAGAAMSFVGYLVERFPAHLAEWELRSVHPLYSLAWIGVAELVRWAAIRPAGAAGSRRSLLTGIAALAAVAALPVAMMKLDTAAFLASVAGDRVLTRLPNGAAAANFMAGLQSPGAGELWASLVPLGLLLPTAAWLLARKSTPASTKLLLMLVLGPVLVTAAFAGAHLRWWHVVDLLLLVLFGIVASSEALQSLRRPGRTALIVLGAAAALPGLIRLAPRVKAMEQTAIPLLEVEGMIERDFARWLAQRSTERSNVIVWAPPSTTATLYYYGGLRGIGSFAWENEDGLSLSTRLARATSNQEAEALIRSRGIRYLVLPSWDGYFDTFAGATANAPTQNFYTALRRWVLPSWLRPLPYQFVKIPGIEDYSVAVFAVVDEQEPATATARIAEFFVEMGLLDYAASAHEALQSYPADLGALAARAQIDAGRGDAEALTRTMTTIRQRIKAGGDRFMAWDRRVSLTIALARAEDRELTRQQASRCLSTITEADLRHLSPGMLFNFIAVATALELPFPEPRWRQLAIELLPPELRAQL